MSVLRNGVLAVAIVFLGHLSRAESLRIAAAADLRYAMDELVAEFLVESSGDEIEVIYGSSGKFATQIQHGAPYDLYFSADITYPRRLEQKKLTATSTRPYALGRIVVWSLDMKRGIHDLDDAALRRIAIANPRHAPYGVRAREALESVGIWTSVEPKLVMGENIAQTAQFVDSGAAEAGIVALSLVMSPSLAGRGHWTLIDDALHQPLEQGYVILQRAAGNKAAQRFDAFIQSARAAEILRAYGFAIPAVKGP